MPTIDLFYKQQSLFKYESTSTQMPKMIACEDDVKKAVDSAGQLLDATNKLLETIRDFDLKSWILTFFVLLFFLIALTVIFICKRKMNKKSRNKNSAFKLSSVKKKIFKKNSAPSAPLEPPSLSLIHI